MTKYILSIDQGTTSTRAMLFDENFEINGTSQIEFKQFFPKDGCVEHDPEEIMNTIYHTVNDVLEKAKITSKEILSIGITNQRETVVMWDKKTGKPVYNAIVWQDRRTAGYCNKLKTKVYQKKFKKLQGSLLTLIFPLQK